MQTALNDIVGFFGSRKSHRCVNVSIEQLANKCGVFECQSISVMTRVCARNEWISVGSPKRHVTTSINWLVAIAQYSCDSWHMAHSAAEISCFEFRWNLRRKLSSSIWSMSNFCSAKCRLKCELNIYVGIANRPKPNITAYLPASSTHWPDQSTDIAVACRSRCVLDHAVSRVTHGASRLLNVSVNDDILVRFPYFEPTELS